ncbi:MAG TPA: hypothetical protein PLI43_06970 [Albidovulum sp.]|uniref:hypothetical protein n=1 Tax=Albidovulum sp. TaxID=1872424 RepID=UPI002B805CC1|nr:hypothetical protein [Albidovulum sp.]
MLRPAVPFAVIAALSACAPAPAVEGAVSPAVTSAAYPKLAPLDTLLAAVPPAPASDPAAPVEARAALLRSRAEALRAAPQG